MLSWQLAWRFAFARSRGQLASFLTRISGVGLLLSVALLVCVLTVMQGFEKEMKGRILNLVPQLMLTSSQGIANWASLSADIESRYEAISASAPLVYQQAMVKHGSQVETLLVYGIDPVLEEKVSDIGLFMQGGEWQSWKSHPTGGLLGKGLAEKLKVTVGDNLMVMVPRSKDGRMQKPVVKRYTVTALVSTGTELDQQLMILPISQVAALAGLQQGQVQGLRFRLHDVFDAIELRYQLQAQLGYQVVVKSWAQTHGNLFHAIRLSKQLVAMILFAIIAVAGFNVISSLVLIVKDRQADIAVLRSLGLSSRKVLASFMLMGLLIASFATFAGVLLGIALAYSAGSILMMLETLMGFQLLNTEVYPVNYLPASLYWPDILLVVLASLAAGLLATLYPAWRAGRLQPAIVLRYE